MTVSPGPLRYILFAVVCLGTFGLGAAGGLLHDDGTIAEGLWVDRVYVGGLTPEQAAARAQQELAGLTGGQLELRYAGRKWVVTNEQIDRRVLLDKALAAAYNRTRGGRILERAKLRLHLADKGEVVPIAVELSEEKLKAQIAEIGRSLDRPAKEARLAQVVETQFFFAPEEDGLKLNQAETLKRAASRAFPPPTSIDMAVEVIPAKLRLAELRRGLNTVLATFRTNMADGYQGVMRENRAHNVRLLLDRFRGRILMPGEPWSFNNDLGPRRVEDGFKQSIIFMRQPDGTIEERWSTGGGICQLATTIFNTALYANLRITERSNHSKTVHYAKPGRDATVYYGSADLKFVNSLANPIALWGELLPNYDLVITIIGNRSDDFDVELESSTWEGKTGKGAGLWRAVKKTDGSVVREREHICDSLYPYAKEKQDSATD